MKLHRFYIGAGNLEKIHKNFIFPSELLHQWKKVFRFSQGDQVVLFDGSGEEYLCEITLLTQKDGEVKVLEKMQMQQKAQRRVELFAALIKKDNFEWILEKTTELGVSEITPVLTERSEKKDLNMERAKRIIVEASEQSGRVTLPVLNEISELSLVIQHVSQKDEEIMKTICFDSSGAPLKDLMESEEVKGGGAIRVFIGPEGGWSEKELGLFRTHNIPIYSLGSNVLRAETAAVAVTSLLIL